MGLPITHTSCIYAIRCKATGRVYIGRTYRLEFRINEHFKELRSGAKGYYAKHSYQPKLNFQKDYDTYGESSFEVYILQENVPPELCRQAEKAWIREYDATNPLHGYNVKNEERKTDFFSRMPGLPPKAWENPSDEAKIPAPAATGTGKETPGRKKWVQGKGWCRAEGDDC